MKSAYRDGSGEIITWFAMKMCLNIQGGTDYLTFLRLNHCLGAKLEKIR